MKGQPLKITKTLRQVTMWVHPEGLVQGALFVAVDHTGSEAEDPRSVVNTDNPFLVLKRYNPDEIRFYNRSSIIRVEYDEALPQNADATRLPCTMVMMDGSIITGRIHECLPPEHARLYDYLNQAHDRFIKIYTTENRVCLVNKSYIIQVTT